ncbi:MAG: aminopeptidase P family protein [Oscillospiraceae bacterium]|jgi:Xaa-Pro aminopeptidase|nr:aminopeptidase P family protein [Oscillospiraceae bacterium]
MNNIEKLKSAVADSGADALMVTGPANRYYFSGFPSSAGILLATQNGAWFMTDSRYSEAAAKAIGNAEVRKTDRENTSAKLINALCAEFGVKTIGFEDAVVTYAEYLDFAKKLDAELLPAQKVFSAQRAVKSREDLDKLIVVERIAEKSFTEILPLISTDITERELAAELVCRFLKNGADDKSFDPIVVSGARSSMPHGVPTDAKLQKGFLTIDFGAKKDGWCSDTTRTLCIGKPTDEMVRVYETVLLAQLAGIATARAGVTGGQVDGAARDVIVSAGYGEYFGHGFGHGLGLEVHESPTAAPTSDAPIPAGAVMSAEPGIYLPGRFGVRIEDVLYITETGNENITKLSKTMIII